MAKTVPCSAEKNSLMAVINSLFDKLGNFAGKPLILRAAEARFDASRELSANFAVLWVGGNLRRAQRAANFLKCFESARPWL